MEQSRETILDVIKTNPEKTANYIAKKVGLAKATNKTKQFISDLIDDGLIHEDINEAGHRVYIPTNPTSSDSTPNQESETTGEVGGFNHLTEEDILPEENFGYKIESSENKRFKYKITCPDGAVRELISGETIVVINPGTGKEGRFHLTPDENVGMAVTKYADDYDFYHYVVKYWGKNETIDMKNVQDSSDVIIFLEVSRHNKAA